MTVCAVAASESIRRASIEDVPTLVAMFTQFVATSRYAQYIGNDARWSERAIAAMIARDDCAIYVAERDGAVIGMLGVSVFTQPFSGECVATEHFWWLDEAHRGRGPWLLRRAERWARECGATRITMMAPADKPRVAEIYRRMGYAEVEHIYQRDL